MRKISFLVVLCAVISCNNSKSEKDTNQDKRVDSLVDVIKRKDDSLAKENDDKRKKKEAADKEQAVIDERNKVYDKVTTGDYISNKVDAIGGIKNLRFYLANDYKYKLEQVILVIHYVRANQNEVHSEQKIITNVAANSKTYLDAPEYKAAGKEFYVTVESVLCKAIDMCYYSTGSRISDSLDPNKCK